jgi:hypothetical protein
VNHWQKSPRLPTYLEMRQGLTRRVDDLHRFDLVVQRRCRNDGAVPARLMCPSLMSQWPGHSVHDDD